jgi:hypothetical protein
VADESSRFERAVALIDEANGEDPNVVLVGGLERPKELAHAEMATEWIRRLRPDASELLLVATRAHHLRRWESPRAGYPTGRDGYLRWKVDLQRRHAAAAEPLLTEAGYGDDEIERVQSIIRKRRLTSDPDVQAFEDALCLVFLETQLDELADKLDDDAMVEVLRKSLDKMSDAAKRLSVEIRMSERGAALVGRALTA